jgi:uncharacterized protein (DUF1015 family)
MYPADVTPVNNGVGRGFPRPSPENPSRPHYQMATLQPFRALRPRPDAAARIAAVPYDVVTTEEARAQAGDNPLSFLRVSRPELELPTGTDPYSQEVYDRAVRNFERLRQTSLVLEDEPSVYFYRLRSGDHEQTGLAACYSLDEYDRGIIKKHERTRRDKEDDRTRHMIALGAQTGPVFLVYRASGTIDEIAALETTKEPLFDFEAADGVRHTLWAVRGATRDALVAAFAGVPALYIADGHHRAASAARAREEIRERATTSDSATFLAVAFPHQQAQILPYNRIVKDLGSLASAALLPAVGSRFEVSSGTGTPARRGEMAMYFERTWYTLRPRVPPGGSDPIEGLDVSVLQGQLLEPVLKIGDVRTDKRIDFVGGARGTVELERLVDSGKAAVAFSLFPVSVADLMAVADAGAIMPPKSTWFEPKLRDGLLVHLF